MSFKSKLFIDGNEYTVLHCHYRIQQNLDATNKPSGVPRGGLINLVIEADDKTDMYDWMITPDSRKTGYIIFYKRDMDDGKMRKIDFTDAYCVDYSEDFDAINDEAMIITFTLSANSLSLNSVPLENKWGTV